MKKKILLMISIMAMLVCIFAISASAADWTYKDEAGQTYLTLTIDDQTGIITEYDGRFPMWTEKNEPLTWYVIKTEGNVKTVKSFVSTDPVYTNHGGGYYRFIKEADFTLKDKYPVPTKENVVSINMPNDMGITAFSNYSAVNFQAGVSYTPNKLEILFARFPNTLTNTERLVQATKVLEVEFDKNSVFTTLSHLAFHESKSLRKVNIPASVTVIASINENHGRAFCNCVSLEEVTFDENSRLTSIQNAAFKDCTSLKEIKLPASMVTIENNTLSYMGGLEILRLPETFTHFVNTNSDGTIRNDHHSFTYLAGDIKEYYLPVSFYATVPDTVYRVSYAFYGGADVKFFYCGNKGQLLNAISNFKSGTSSATDNNGNFTNATPVAYADYLANPDNYKTGDYIIYDYSACDAFHGGNHDYTVKYGFAGEKYLSDYCAYSTCNDCGKKETRVVTSALFTCHGYSAPENGAGGIAVGFTVNNEAIKVYEEISGKVLTYGVFAAAKEKLGTNDIFGTDGKASNGVINAEITSYAIKSFELRICGFGENNKSVLLALGAYVIASDKEATDAPAEYSYLQASTPNAGEKYAFVSYNDIVGKSTTDKAE